ncbi:MAG: hypothetical protein RJA05_870 [Planctomycetota bacterium]|jgi:hypothetical protein
MSASGDALPAWADRTSGELKIRVKAVPGSSRDRIAGPLGDRLKVCVAAPPEGGRANEAIASVLARALGVAQRSVVLRSGATTPLKEFAVLDEPTSWPA